MTSRCQGLFSPLSPSREKPWERGCLTKRKRSSNGSANVKHSEAMSDEIVTAMSTAFGASIFVFELFKKNLESICCPSYKMNAGSWQAWVFLSWCMQYMNIERNNKLLASWGKEKEIKNTSEGKRKEKNSFVCNSETRTLALHPFLACWTQYIPTHWANITHGSAKRVFLRGLIK